MVELSNLRKLALELDQKRDALLSKLLSHPGTNHCIQWYVDKRIREALARRRR